MARGEPREQYERTYILLPPDVDKTWARSAAVATWDARRFTIGGSADDAGIGDLDKRRVIAVNPAAWGDGEDGTGLQGFYERYYPGVTYRTVTVGSGIELEAELKRFVSSNPLSGLMSGTRVSVPSPTRGTPREPYERTVVLLPPNATLTWARAVVDATWETQRLTILGSADDAGIGDLAVRKVIAVNPEAWGPGEDGMGLRGFFQRYYPGVEYQPLVAAIPNDLRIALGGDATIAPPPADLPQFSLGIHDLAEIPAGRWLQSQNVGGWVYVAHFVGTGAHRFNFSQLEADGIRVVVNLRYSFSTDLGGGGNVPPERERDGFVRACRETVQQSQGVWGWTIGNEPNNPREWPLNEPQTPERLAHIYNAVRRDLGGRFSPGPVDPFFGPGSDNRDWFSRIWRASDGAEFVDIHGYVRGADPTLCWRSARFGNAPLEWQALNFFGCCESLLAALPGRFRALPVIISEFNHLWKERENDLGWLDGSGVQVVRAAHKRIVQWNQLGNQTIMALILYRYDGDEWILRDKPAILNEMVQLNRPVETPRFANPVQNRSLRINMPFGIFGHERNYGLHEGLDLFAFHGDPIVPIMDGRVTATRDIHPRGYGRYVRIAHDNGMISWYGHLDRPSVREGERVIGGQTVLGLADNSGNSTGDHLHLTVQWPGRGLDGFVVEQVIDPMPYLAHLM